MKSGILSIGVGIVCLSIMIYLIKNYKNLCLFWDKIKDKKITTIISKILIIVVICSMIYYIYELILGIQNSINFFKYTKENDIVNEYNDNKIIEEYKFYNNSMKANYESQNSQNPYIPDGFSYVEGEWNSGFVIQDTNGNQYVWVPCTNKENTEIPKLERRNFSKQPFISKDICINENCEEFILSSLENGGFYISRYEIGKENNLPVSKSGVEIYGNITRKEAMSEIEKMYRNLNCELINGYAYDTTLSWLNNTNKIEINKIEENENIKTGRKKYNNIYDFIDNILEITTESSYGTVIVRGFLFSESEEESENSYLEKMTGVGANSLDRISIREEDNYYTPENIMGFRTVLYK